MLKITGWKGVWDSSKVTITDWKKELEPFTRCAIHRPSMRNSYRVDTVIDGDAMHIVYTARERLPVQRQEVWKQGESVLRFSAITGDTNMIFGLERKLEYVADSGYLITGRQEMKMTKPADYSIRLLWK